jgi:hypothetical protein
METSMTHFLRSESGRNRLIGACGMLALIVIGTYLIYVAP